MQLSIQGYLQQGKRLNPEIFPYPDRNCLMDFYHSGEPEPWNGYLLAATDGSRAEVPDSEENRETSGNSGSRHSKTGRVRVPAGGMYDILNHFYPDIETEHVSVSENELAERNLIHLGETETGRPVPAVFDRGYPSLEFTGFPGTGGFII